MGIKSWLTTATNRVSIKDISKDDILFDERLHDFIYYKVLKVLRNRYLCEYIIVSKHKGVDSSHHCLILDSLEHLVSIDKVPSKDGKEYDWNEEEWI